MDPHSQPRRTGGRVMWQPPSLEHMQALLPQYEFLKILGRGGMGAVYKARQLSLDRLVAIKILPPDIIEEDDEVNFVERFKNEARTMAKMNHPGIVNVYDFGETEEGQLYFVMEFVDGTDVAQMIRSKGRLPSEHALAIAAHVCDALDYAHRQGVMHRDIKPANVLINREGQVKVADFGLAKVQDAGHTALTRSNVAMGTPDFMAPEAMIAGMKVDQRADLYAVGVMLYNMLTGEVPRGRFRPASEKAGCDPRFDAIIDRAMESEIRARYQSAPEIRGELDSILTTPLAKSAPLDKPAALVEETNEAKLHPVKSVAAPRSPQASPRAPLALVLASVVVVAAGGAFLLLREKKEKPADPTPQPVAAIPVQPPQIEPSVIPQQAAVSTPKPAVAAPQTPVVTASPPLASSKPAAKPAITPSAEAAGPAVPDIPVKDAKLTELESAFRDGIATQADAPHEAEIAKLNGQYLAALDRAKAAAQAKGLLDEVLALDGESRAVVEKGAPPGTTVRSPASLVTLRKTYQESAARFAAERAKRAAVVYDQYLTALDGHIVELTKANRLREAVVVRSLRSSVEAQRPQIDTAPTAVSTVPATPPASPRGRQVLFDGKSLSGWRIIGSPDAFVLDNGTIKTAEAGPSSLVYVGDGQAPLEWRDLDLSFRYRATRGANSGIWIHCPTQSSEPRALALEVAISNSPTDSNPTGSFWGIQPLKGPAVNDRDWVDMRVQVAGSTAVVYINGREVNRWTQPPGWQPGPNIRNARLGSGSIGFQSWGGNVWFKDIVLTLPESAAGSKPDSGGASPEVLLFDGKTLAGWAAFPPSLPVRVENGALRIGGAGTRELAGHLFYVGQGTEQPEFRNFEVTVTLRTERDGNSDLYFHARPSTVPGTRPAGIPVQIWNEGDFKPFEANYRTGSLYAIAPYRIPFVRDGEWFDMKVRVEGARVQVFLRKTGSQNWQQTADWTQPTGWQGVLSGPSLWPDAKLGSGTFAFSNWVPQNGVVWAKDIRLSLLP